MAERIKLQEPGSELVMTVSKVTPEVINKNDYYLFTDGARELLVPQSSVEAQIGNNSMGRVENFMGKSVRFARSMKMSRANKPYWDISWANGSGAEQSAGGEGNAGKPASAPSAEPATEKPKLTALYLAATEFVLDKIVPKFEEKEIGVSDTAIVAAIATLFIAASKER